MLIYQCTLYNSQVILTDCMKNFGVYMIVNFTSIMMLILFFQSNGIVWLNSYYYFLFLFNCG
jgi:hypothetical protein